MTYPDVMIDLETLGVKPGSVLLSIGAYRFNLNAGTIDMDRPFYRKINAADQQRRGMTINGETVAWWLTQSRDAQLAAISDAALLPTVLVEFDKWWAEGGCERPWGNGVAFDCGLLSAAYEACEMKAPWKFWNERCFRTIKAHYPSVKRDEVAGTKHNAKDDALAQVQHLMKIREFAIARAKK